MIIIIIMEQNDKFRQKPSFTYVFDSVKLKKVS